MKAWKDISIKTKINIVVMPGIVFVVFFVATVILFKLRSALYLQLERRALAVVKNFASSSAFAVATGDTDYLNKVAERFLLDEDIIYISIRDTQGKSLFERLRSDSYREKIEKIVSVDFVKKNKSAVVRGIILVVEPLEIKASSTEEVPEVAFGLEERKLGHALLGISTKNIDRDFRRVLGFSGGVVFLFLLAGVIFITFAMGRLLLPVKEMLSATQKVTSGDLTVKVEAKNEDEIGTLAVHFSRMLDSLRDVLKRLNEMLNNLLKAEERVEEISSSIREGSIKQKELIKEIEMSLESINTAAHNIAENTEILNSSAQESSSAVLEMNASVEEVSEHMEKLSSSVNETTSSVQEMAVSIKQVAANVMSLTSAITRTVEAVEEIEKRILEIKKNADEMTKSNEKVMESAKVGEGSLMKTISQIEKIREVSGEIAKAINSLKDRLGEITKIVNVIDDIAEQTNLLALNAAIISAQSGERGRGFSVVADNIKELSDRTSQSTQEIIVLIDGIFNQMENVVKIVEAGSKAVEEGVNIARETGKLFHRITESARDSYEKSSGIASATGEQARFSKSVRESTKIVSDMAQEMKKAIDEQAKGSELINKAAESMRDIADFVKTSMSELSKSAKHVNQLMENISEMVKFITETTKEQSLRTKDVMTKIGEILAVSEDNVKIVQGMKEFLDDLVSKSRAMEEVTKTFKIRR